MKWPFDVLRTAAIGLLAVGATWGCTPDDELRRGEVGEWCNDRDDDCRQGLICEQSVCATSGPAPIYDCADICNKLEECDAREDSCASDCRLTTSEWALRARNEFGVCVVEGLTCQEAQASFGPQTCYQRIEVPDARRARCDEFVEFSRGCGAPVETLERVLEGCVALARVSRDAGWEATAQCASEQETGICSEVATCFNEVLGLESPVTL